MADLNTYLLQEYARATNEGREPCYNISSALSNAINQIQQHGFILNSTSDGHDFLNFIDMIGHQLHPFNTTKVVTVNAADYENLDPQQKFVFSHIMDQVMGQDTLIVGDLGGVNRLFIGPVDKFQITLPAIGFQSLTVGGHPLIPNFQLPPGQTWAQFANAPLTMGLADVPAETVPVSQESLAPKKAAERVPRPPNPFIIYRAAHHKSVSDAHPDASNNEISKKIGRQWQAESDDVRNAYRQKAAEIKNAFMRAHPGYKYQPRKSSEVKRRAKKTINEDDEDDEEEENDK